MKKTCIFCGCRANTSEDVMPKWILRLLRKQERERVPMRTYRLGQPPKDRLVKESAQNVRNVCGMCNNGWMSHLEEDVKPIFTDMVLGRSVSLTLSQRERITTWLTKCAIMYESMVHGEKFYNGLDRHHFMNTVSPLQSTSVWLGRYTGCIARQIVDYRLLYRQQGQAEPVQIIVLTMVVGQLALQLASAKWTAPVPQIDLPTFVLPTTKDLLVQVWPATFNETLWPPSISFDDAGNRIKYLVVRFGGRELENAP